MNKEKEEQRAVLEFHLLNSKEEIEIIGKRLENERNEMDREK